MKRISPAAILVFLVLVSGIQGQFGQPPRNPQGPQGPMGPGFPNPQPNIPPRNMNPGPEFQNPQFPPGPIFVQKKVCSRCNKEVPNSAKVGDKCPHCGALWVFVEGDSGQSQTGPGILASQLSDGNKSSSLGSIALHWVIIGLGFVISGIIVSLTVRFLKNHI
jgi:hypothetical protein